MFIKYQSKPITRLAHKVTESDVITEVEDKESTSVLNSSSSSVAFKHYEPVLVGDYIVYLNEDDIYHCSAKVFAERNIIPS